MATTSCQRCRHGMQQALTDDLLLSAIDRTPLLTNVIDQLPPWRARMIVTVALSTGAALQNGTPELFEEAARAAGKQDASQSGWWRRALGMPPRGELPPAPPAGTYVPPAGWTVVGGEGGI